MSYIYLASPYTHKIKQTMNDRYRAVAAVTAAYLRSGLFVYAPIVHCHELAVHHALPRDFEFWKAYNYAMLQPASDLHILQLKGWDESTGVSAEIKRARELNIPITYVEPNKK